MVMYSILAQDFFILGATLLENAGVITSIIVAACSVMAFFHKAMSKMTILEFKVNTMWDFQMRRAKSEAVNKGGGTLNSPLRLKDEARDWFSGMTKDLKAFYASLPKPIEDRDLFIAIENKFGERMLKDICIPYGFDSGGCTIIAMEIAKEPVLSSDGQKMPESEERRLIRLATDEKIKNAVGIGRTQIVERLIKAENKINEIKKDQIHVQIQSDKTDQVVAKILDTTTQINKDQAVTNKDQAATNKDQATTNLTIENTSVVAIKNTADIKDIKLSIADLVVKPLKDLKESDVVAVIPEKLLALLPSDALSITAIIPTPVDSAVGLISSKVGDKNELP